MGKDSSSKSMGFLSTRILFRVLIKFSQFSLSLLSPKRSILYQEYHLNSVLGLRHISLGKEYYQWLCPKERDLSLESYRWKRIFWLRTRSVKRLETGKSEWRRKKSYRMSNYVLDDRGLIKTSIKKGEGFR